MIETKIETFHWNFVWKIVCVCDKIYYTKSTEIQIDFRQLELWRIDSPFSFALVCNRGKEKDFSASVQNEIRTHFAHILNRMNSPLSRFCIACRSVRSVGWYRVLFMYMCVNSKD